MFTPMDKESIMVVIVPSKISNKESLKSKIVALDPKKTKINQELLNIKNVCDFCNVFGHRTTR